MKTTTPQGKTVPLPADRHRQPDRLPSTNPPAPKVNHPPHQQHTFHGNEQVRRPPTTRLR